MKRVYVDDADYGLALKYAIAAACVEANKGGYNKIVFLTLMNDHKKTTEESIKGICRVQMNGKATCIAGCHVNYVVATLKKYKSGLAGPHDVVVYCGLMSEEIISVEEVMGIGYAIAVKEYRSITLWGETWGVAGLSAKGLNLPSFYAISPTPKVQNAIRRLTHAINLTNRTAFNTSDDELIKAYVRTLYKYEQRPIATNAIISFAIRECGWNLKQVNQMASYFEKMNNGKSFKGGIASAAQMKTWYDMW